MQLMPKSATGRAKTIRMNSGSIRVDVTFLKRGDDRPVMISQFWHPAGMAAK